MDLDSRIRKLKVKQEMFERQLKWDKERSEVAKLQFRASQIITKGIFMQVRHNLERTKQSTVQWDWEEVEELVIPQQQNTAHIVVQETVWESCDVIETGKRFNFTKVTVKDEPNLAIMEASNAMASQVITEFEVMDEVSEFDDGYNYIWDYYDLDNCGPPSGMYTQMNKQEENLEPDYWDITSWEVELDIEYERNILTGIILPADFDRIEDNVEPGIFDTEKWNRG